MRFNLVEISKKEFLDAVLSVANEVYDFHTRWQKVSRTPSSNIGKVASEVVPVLSEEVKEFEQEVVLSGLNEEDLCEEAGDVLFVALGAILRFGKKGTLATKKVVSKNAKKTAPSFYFDDQKRKVKRA